MMLQQKVRYMNLVIVDRELKTAKITWMDPRISFFFEKFF